MMIGRTDARRGADDLRALLEPGAIRAVFQPIVRLTDLEPIGYEGLARFPTPPGLVALPPDVTLAAAARSGLRDELEVACWAAMAEAGAPPDGRLLFVNVAPDALGHPGLARARRPAAVAARDRAHRAGRRPGLRPAARAPAPVDRARRAGRRRRRRRRLHLARVRGRDPPRLPQAVPRDGHRRRSRPQPPGRAARDRRVRPRGRRARSSPRASSAPRSSRCCATPRSTSARAGCSAARAEPWPRSRAPTAAVPRRRGSPAAGALERALAAAPTRARRLRGRGRPPGPAGPDAERLPRAGRPPALPGGARLLADL